MVDIEGGGPQVFALALVAHPGGHHADHDAIEAAVFQFDLQALARHEAQFEGQVAQLLAVQPCDQVGIDAAPVAQQQGAKLAEV
ncbi:hypothetical protein LP420_09365 [Massilia sp. B-10]|nr:hypothetical protein LP420_09365 [Massilia sp. B-10]